MFVNGSYLSGLHTGHVAFQGPVQGSNLHKDHNNFFIFYLFLSYYYQNYVVLILCKT